MKPTKKRPTRIKKPGRQSLLTPETQLKFITSLKASNYRDASCAYAGVSRPTFYEWMAKGEDAPKSVYGEFRQQVLDAEGQAEDSLVKGVRIHVPTDWRAALALLERRYPSRWARREIRTHDGKIDTTGDAGPKVTDFAHNPEAVEKYNEFLAAVASAHGADPSRARDSS